MKTILLSLICLAIITNSYAQSFTATTTNTSANSKTITSGTNPIYKPSLRGSTQVQSDLNMENNSIAGYNINFYAAPLTTENNTSTSGACLLQDNDGNTFTGVLKDDAMAADPSGIIKYSCSFSKDDFYKIAAIKKITAIKIFSGDNKTGDFPVNNGLQETILMQAKSLLNALPKQQ